MKINDLIISEDENFVAVNKPSGLLSIPDREGKESSLKEMLQNKYGEIFTVHRLDRDTSGIVVFARNEQMHKNLSLQFENRKTKKIYNGLVLGNPMPASGIINQPIAENTVRRGVMIIHARGKESITNYEVLQNFKQYAWMQFHILTGRTHQIRVHMKHLGNPIVCDPVYGDGKPVLVSTLKKKFKLAQSADEERPILNRLALHAAQLSFSGLNGEEHSLVAELPKDLRATVNQLRKTAPPAAAPSEQY
ncbi:MAG: RluA family pseudouridine synthase [Bacteroidota bacterium]